MTVIRNNSISGINSITAQSSALNFYDSAGNDLTLAFGNGLNVTSGSVGIGTDNPTKKLDVQGTDANGLLVSAPVTPEISLKRRGGTSATGNIDWVGSTNVVGARIGVNDDIAGSMQFKLGGTGVQGDTKMIIESNGNLGIGTDNPDYKVHVEGTGEVFLNVVGDVAPAGGGANLRLQNKNTTASALNQIQSADAGGQTTSAISFYNVDNTTNEGYIMFLTRPSGGSPAEAARFTSAGNLRFPSGQGIDFSATSDSSGTMTSELLDDYEEGTWTPDLRFNGSNTGITYSWRNGHYIRIGKQVTVRAAFGLSSKGTFTSTDDADIYGLPFNIQDYSGSGQFFYTFGGAYNGYGGLIMLEVQNNAAENNNIQLRKLSAFNTDSTAMEYQDVGGSQRIAFSLTYIAV